MKLKSFLFLLFVLSLTACLSYGQKVVTGSGNVKTEVRNLPGFTGVESLGSIDVFITKADNVEVKIEADDNLLPNIITEVKGNTLIIRMKENFNYRQAKKMYVYVAMPNITALATKGSGSIKSESKFNGDNLVIKTQGSGSIQFSFDGKRLEASTQGSGGIKFSGSVNNVDLSTNGSGSVVASVECESANLSVRGSGGVNVSGNVSDVSAEVQGSGNITGYGFQSKRASVTIQGSGNCNLSISDNLVGKIHGSGNIHYKGNATVISQHNSGSGKIIKE
jgi:hypothetical protein